MATSGAVIARIISQYSDKGSKAAQKDIAKMGKQIDAWSKRVVKSYAVAGAAVAAFALKLGKDAVQGAMEDQKQQAALAVALRNTAGATDAAIAANQKYLDSLELQVAIDNDQLIPALQKLVTATGDLSYAQALLSLSTDVAAASGKDLNTVAVALSQAVGGNFTALKKLRLPLDENALAAGNLKKILADLGKISAGQASAAANTFAGKMEKLRLTINQTLDKLGYALIPVIEQFATYIITDVIPNIDAWVEANEKGLQDSFKAILDTVAAITVNMVRLIVFIEKYKEVVAFIALVPVFNVFIGQIMLVYNIYKKIMPIVNAVFSAKTLGTVKTLGSLLAIVGRTFVSGGIIAGFKSMLTLLSMMSPHVKALSILFVSFQIGQAAFNKFFNSTDKAVKKAKVNNAQIEKDRKAAILDGFKSIEVATEAANAERERADAIARSAQEQKKAADAEKRRAKIEADYAKINARIAKEHKVKLLSSDEEKLVQINAAEALLNRQKTINALDKERLDRMKEEILSLKVRNDLAKRYQDILQALADNKIDTKEIAILAKMWEVPVEAVDAYLATLFAVEDATITDDEIVNLAMKWGSTQAQAAQYLDFYQYLNDGILSDAEIEKLKTKWKMTEEQVRMYADFVGVVNDGKLTDAEIVKIQDKWKLTTDQVVDYIKKIGSPVSYSGTLIDPARAAEIGWLNATAALQRYLDLLKAGTGVVVPNPITPPVVVPPVVIPPKTDGSGLGGSRTDSAASAASAIAYAVAKAAGDEVGAAIAAAGVTPSALASQESGAIGALSIARQLAEAENQVRIASSLAAFKAKEAADAAASIATSAQMDYDERFRFRNLQSGLASGTVATGASISSGNLMAAPIVNVTVQGSVTSEQDLVTTIRNGLLSQQYNGDSITLQAV
jgi:hypothetical protein